jgi:dTDP-glucose pyrophosphorylase
MRRIQLVIPAAGLGSRFSSVGMTTPKPVIDVDGLPMIAWVIGNFKLRPTDVVIIVTRPEIGLSETLLPYLHAFQCRVEFVYIDYVTEGPAITVSLAKALLDLDEALVVANSDQYVSAGLDEFLNQARYSSSGGQILTMAASGSKWSYVKRTSAGNVSEVKEKVEISNEATVGIYGWNKASYFFESLETMIAANDRTNGEFYVAPTYNYLIERTVPISAINIGDVEREVHGLGTPEDLEIFEAHPDLRHFLHSVKTNLGLSGVSLE